MPKRGSSTRKVFFEEEMEEEVEEEGGARKGLDQKLFRELTQELDEAIDGTMKEIYRGTLDEFYRILNDPCELFDCVPTLFLSGHCLDWNWLFDRLRTRHPDLVIKSKFDAATEELVAHIESERDDRLTKSGKKLLLFFQSNLLSKREVFERVFSLRERRVFVLLVVHTSISFASIDERIPRNYFVQMRVHSMPLPPAENFLLTFFSAAKIKLGLLPKANVQFHACTLNFVRQLFVREFRTLSCIRKPLVLALLEYATKYGFGKRPNANERIEFAKSAEKYLASLQAFFQLTDTEEVPKNPVFIFKLHCQIQRKTDFTAFYKKQRVKWEHWTGDKWQNKFKVINKFIEDNCQQTQFKELVNKLNEQQKQNRIEQTENVAPMKKSSSRLRNSLKRVPSNSAKFFGDQQKLLGRRTHPLDAKLRTELLQFLDSFFLENLQPFPDKFIAGPGPPDLLDPSLSGELDHSLADDFADKKSNLDIVLAYRLLVTHTDSFKVQVSSLQDAFDSLAEPIDGLKTEARLMAALSQLEHIGVVKSVLDDFVRLIYLPGAALTKDLFENGNK